MGKKCVKYHAKDYKHVVMVWQCGVNILASKLMQKYAQIHAFVCEHYRYLFQDANSHEKAQEKP